MKQNKKPENGVAQIRVQKDMRNRIKLLAVEYGSTMESISNVIVAHGITMFKKLNQKR